MQYFRLFIWISICLIILSALLVACGEQRETAGDIRSVYKDDDTTVEINRSDYALQTRPVAMRTLESVVEASAQLQANSNAVTRIAAPLMGRVGQIRVSVGDAVKTGQILMYINSQEIASLESELFKAETEIEAELSKDLLDLDYELEQANAQLALIKKQAYRARTLNAEKIAAAAEMEAAETALERQNLLVAAIAKKRSRTVQVAERKKQLALRTLQQKLIVLGMQSKDVTAILTNKTIDTQIPISATQPGVVLERNVNPGEMVDTSKTLLVIDDLDNLWLVADVFEQDLGLVRVGQKVAFTVDSFPNKKFQSTLTFVAGAINPETRTLAVRAEIQNEDLKLKPKMFARMKIYVEPRRVLCVPKSAVQDAGPDKVLYILQANGKIREAPVQIGMESDQYIEIKSGASAGDQVVTAGAFNLRAEFARRQR
jgi:membrane fusion protein, heavy metal efflux system